MTFSTVKIVSLSTFIVLGAALGAVDDDGDAGEGAVSGAIAGALADTMKTPRDREQIIVACMQQRGHRVVG